MIGLLGRHGPAATHRQLCPQMTRRHCRASYAEYILVTLRIGTNGYPTSYISYSDVILSLLQISLLSYPCGMVAGGHLKTSDDDLKSPTSVSSSMY